MEYVRSIEKTMKDWYKDLPHLPKELSKWLAQNAWSLTLIGVVFGVISLLGTLSLVGVGMAYAGLIAPVVGIALTGLWLWIAFFAVVLAIEAMAIVPLKAMQRRGWELMFLALLISSAGGVASDVLRGNVSGVLGSVIGFAIGSYVLLEVDHYFAAKATK